LNTDLIFMKSIQTDERLIQNHSKITQNSLK